MPIDIPDDWPSSGWVENPPLAHLRASREDENGLFIRDWQVASWESTREIAASSLPGQVRAKTGLSIGTGKALIRRQSDDFPWKKRAVYELTGMDAEIQIAPEHRTKIPTGQFQVAEISGDLTTLGVDVDLDEKTIVGRDKTANVRGWTYEEAQGFPGDIATGATAEVDPVWWISELGRQIGYGVTSLVPGQDGYYPWMDIPFQGSVIPTYPRNLDWYMTTDSEPLTWGRLDGGIVALQSYYQAHYRGNAGRLIRSATYTLDLLGETEFRWIKHLSDGSTGIGYVSLVVENRHFDPDELYIILDSGGANDIDNSSVTLTLDGTEAPWSEDRPYGVQVQLEMVETSGSWTSARMRARRSPDLGWSSWVTHTMTNTPGAVSDDFRLRIVKQDDTGDGKPHYISRLSIVDNDNTGNTVHVDSVFRSTSGTNGRLYLEPLLGTITSPWISSELSTWAAMQEVVEAWQGALITDVYGDLRVMNRMSLTGVGVGTEVPIDVGLKFEDLPWVSNHTDQADRLVVKYRPARAVTVDQATWGGKLPIIWEASEVIPTYPGGNDIFFNTEYLYLMWTAELPWVQKGSPDYDEIRHTWDAYRYSNGTGAHIVVNTDIGIRIEQVTVSTWKVYVDNRTTSPFHLVDNTGSPWLKVRSYYHMDQTQETYIERGVPASEARNPLEINLENYVQNEADANELADFIWGRVNHRAWRASTINTVPDYRLDLGDVVEITHERTGVRSNALVTKVNLAGQPGQVTQKIDLILIPPTWEDFDEAWAAYVPDPPGSWAEFDSLWDNYTWEDFDRTPTATTVAEIEEAM